MSCCLLLIAPSMEAAETAPIYDPAGVAFIEKIRNNVKPVVTTSWEGEEYSKYPGLTWSDDSPRVLKEITLPPPDCLFQGKLDISYLPGLERIHISFIDELDYGKIPHDNESQEKIVERGALPSGIILKSLRVSNLPDLISLNVGWKLNNARAIDLQDLATLPNLRELNLDYGLYEQEDYEQLKHLKKLEILSLNESTFDDFSVLSELPNLKSVSFQGLGREKVITPAKGTSTFPGISFKSRRTPLRITGLKSSSLVNLNLRGNNIENISGLENIPHLKLLVLTRNNISRIEGLDYLTELKELNLSANNLTKIEGLDKLTQLEVLKLNGNAIAKLEGLEGLTSLKRLELPAIQDFEKIDSLINLEELNISYYAISNFNPPEKYKDFKALDDLSKLRGLKKLKSLKINSAEIGNLKELSGLVGLKRLEINNSGLDSLEGIENLTGLTYLRVSHNKITDLSHIKNLTNLLELDISGSYDLSDLSALRHLTQLQKLTITSLKPTDISFLQNLRQLRHLDLAYNKLTNLKGIKGLDNLEFLSLHENPITDLSGLAEAAPQLKELDLSSTKIADLSPVKNLKHLTTLNCRYAALKGHVDIYHWPKITNLNLVNNLISDLSGYYNLPVTATINVNGNSLPLSVIFRLMQDEIETGRHWEYTENSQRYVGGNIKLRKGDILDLSQELEIGGQKTRFEVYDVTSQRGYASVDQKKFMVGKGEDGRFIFKKTGRFIIVMSNEAVKIPLKRWAVSLLGGGDYKRPLGVSSGLIIVE